MEKKKNIIIGILLAIMFLLMGFIVAMMVMVKSKENSDINSESTSTSTTTSKINISTSTTTSKMSEKTTMVSSPTDEYEKKLNEKLSSEKTLEKKYNLQRKVSVSKCSENYCVNLKYLYNNKTVIEINEKASLFDMEILDYVINDMQIVDFFDSVNNDKYYFLYYIDNYEVPFLNFYNTNFEPLKNANNVLCAETIKKDGEYIYDNHLSFTLANDKNVNYIEHSYDKGKVYYHKLSIEKGAIKDRIYMTDSDSQYSFAGAKC